ncbi:putative aldo-keto reductase 2 [Chlorella vulgaris]
MAALEERRGVRVPSELHGVPPRPLEEYARARIFQFAQAFAARLNPTVAPAVVQQAALDCVAALPPADYTGVLLEQRDLQLVFRHDCLSLGCLDAQCVLCEHNPHRRCSVNFSPKYLVNDVLKAKCDAPIRVELIDRATGQPIQEDLPDLMCVLDGNAYDAKVTEAGEERDEDLEACALLLNNKAQALLQTGPGATHNANSKVQMSLSKGAAVLPDLHVSDSSEAMLSGRKPPFRLLVKAVHLRGQAISVRHAVSEGFVVATRRTRTAGKVEIPNVDDHISKLEHMGKETVKKLQDIRGSALGAGIDISVPDNTINKVGEFRKLALLAEADGHLRQKLQQVLKLSKEKWEEARDHAMRAVVADNRMRIWYADKANMDVGLLFTCRLGDVDLDRPVGLLTKKAQEGAQTTMEATLMAQQTPAQRDQVRALQPQGVGAWWQQGHPGWAIYPVDSEQFLSTGALDSVSLPLPADQLMSGGSGSHGGQPAYAPSPAGPVPALPPSAANNPSLASAFLAAGGEAGGGGGGGGDGGGGPMDNEAILRAMSPYLHGSQSLGPGLPPGLTGLNPLLPGGAVPPALPGMSGQASAFAAPPPHSGTGPGPAPFGSLNAAHLLPPLPPLPLSKPDDGGGPPPPSGLLAPGAGSSFNLASLTGLLGGDLSRLPQLASLAQFPSFAPGMSGDLEMLLRESSLHPLEGGARRAPSFNLSKIESLNLPDEMMMAAILQLERGGGGLGASLPPPAAREQSAGGAALAAAVAAAQQDLDDRQQQQQQQQQPQQQQAQQQQTPQQQEGQAPADDSGGDGSNHAAAAAQAARREGGAGESTGGGEGQDGVQLLLGYAYPAYKTYKVVQLPATRTNDTLLRQWCCYWALIAVFTTVQPVVDTFFFWLPLYYEAKLVAAIYLWANELEGTRRPLVARYEPLMDHWLAESKSLAREWLHSNSMRLLALAQQKFFQYLSQLQQQVPGSGGGAQLEAPARRSRKGPSRTGSKSRRAAEDSPEESEEEEEEEEALDGSEEEAEEEVIVAVPVAAGGKKAKGRGKKKGAGSSEVPAPSPSRFSSFSLASFYSSRSSDLQADDLRAGLKAFPIITEKDDNTASSKERLRPNSTPPPSCLSNEAAIPCCCSGSCCCCCCSGDCPSLCSAAMQFFSSGETERPYCATSTSCPWLLAAGSDPRLRPSSPFISTSAPSDSRLNTLAMQLRLVLIQPRVVARLRAMTLSRSTSTQAAGTGAPSAAATTPQPLPSRRPRSGLVLGIESSCDDTGVAVVTTSGRVLGESLATQAEIHAAWGGVVPKLAQEAHEAAIDGCVEAALSAAGVTADQLDAVAVTIGPGLGLCLRVGVLKARQLAAAHQLPVVPVHHMEAHALVARLGATRFALDAAAQAAARAATATHQAAAGASASATSASTAGAASLGPAAPAADAAAEPPPAALVEFPFLCLLISGGHNQLLLVEGVGQYTQLGTTLDDALGEAYDKVARLLGLDLMPSGGAALEAFALEGNPREMPFSVPMQRHANCDFSYAGLKTAVRLAIEEHAPEPSEANRQVRADIAASFQRVAVKHLEERCRRAVQWAQETHPEVRHLVVAGGVASNRFIRSQLTAVAQRAGLELVCPPPRLCTDNGVMVAWAGVERLQLGLEEAPPAAAELGEGEWLDLRPRWPLTDRKDPRCFTATKSARKKRIFTGLTQLMEQQQEENEATATAAAAAGAAQELMGGYPQPYPQPYLGEGPYAADGGPGLRTRGHGQPQSITRQLNSQILAAANMQELSHLVMANCALMNAVNFCTAYHRTAKHVQDKPIDTWPPHLQHQLGAMLTQLNLGLTDRLEEVQAHNLGLTLWSLSKTRRLPSQHCDELCAALQVEIVRRLSNVSQQTYMTDKYYLLGAQALSNIIYSLASMAAQPDYELLRVVAKAIVWQVGEFKPQGLANTIWGLGKLGVKVTTHEVRSMVDALCGEVTAQLTHSRHKGNFAPQNVSNVLHGIVNIGYCPSAEMLSALVQSANSQLRHFGPQELTNMVWALSQLFRSKAPFGPDTDALLTRIPDELALMFGDRQWRRRMKPQTLSNLAMAYAHLRRRPQLLMTMLMKEALPLLPTFKPQELSTMLWAMATMDFFPGQSTVEAIARTAGAAADKMKPQEIANSCWAFATMRFFPGAAVLDRMITYAEASLDRFKSQETGMMCWAMARLAYMPAATLVRATLPLIANWRSPAVQDCGNVLWSFTVLGILTPEVMALLAEKMLSLPRENFTQEAYIQLYQAKMSLSQHVFDIAAYVPPELLSRGETEDVSNVVTALGIDHDIERRIEDGLMSVDIALRSEQVAVEVDGSAHFTQNEPFVPLGRTLWRWRLLASRGWKVVSVPYFRWGLLKSLDDKKKYLYQLLQCENPWECYGLDPHNPDAPAILPANLAHLTPDEVFRLAAQGVAFSSLVPQQQMGSSTPTTSPSTPLLSGLSPAMNSGVSCSFTPTAGLRPASASSAGSGPPAPGVGLPLPLSLPMMPGGGSGQLPAAGSAPAAAHNGSQQGNGYNKLPDNLYGSDSPRGNGTSSSSSAAFSSSTKLGGGLNVSARPFAFAGGAAAFGPAASSPLPALPTGSASARLRSSSARASPEGAMLSFGGGGQYTPSPPPPPPTLPPAGPPLHQPPAELRLPQLPSPVASARLSPTASESAAAGAALSQAGMDDASDDDTSDLRSLFGAVIGVSQSGPQQRGPLSTLEVRRKLALLPPGHAVADVAANWLAGWDAEQVVGLLRKLESPTVAARALELFAWLRSLPPDSPQAQLYTPGAAAAVIGLYGSWRKPKPAVRLFAELKERMEDTAEVHSALVETCEQYEVAMDAYRNMEAQGIPLSPAALCAVLDHHMQAESWEEADTMLAAWAEQGPDREVAAQVFNTVIKHASEAGNTAAAQSAYAQMCAAGVAPSAATFSALLSALRSHHSAAEAVEMAADLASQADAAKGAIFGFSGLALLDACHLNGWSDVSLQLLARVEEAGGSPGLDMLNSVLAACAKGGSVAEVRQAFEALERHGVEPSPASYQHVVQALCGAGQWAEAAQTYRDMLASGLEPGAELASLIVDALWCTGLAWAQAAALDLFNQATSAGWLRVLDAKMFRGLLTLDLHATHLGTGMLRMHRWLADQRRVIGNSAAPCLLDEAKRVCVVSGRCAEGLEITRLAGELKDCLGASLVLHKAPFRLTHEAGRALRLETSAFMLKKWLFTEDFDQWDLAFRGAAVLAQNSRQAAEGLRQLEAQREEQSSQTYARILEYQAVHGLDAAALRLTPYLERRRELVGAAQQLARGLGSGTAQVWHAAVVLLDRCAAAGYRSRMDALLAAACVALAAEKEGMALPTAQLAALLDAEATHREAGAQPLPALDAELQQVTAALQGDTACLSAMHCWKVFADCLGCDVESPQQMEALLGDSFSRLHLLVADPAFTSYPPSVLAAAAVFLGRKQRGVLPFWPSVLQRLTGHSESLHSEFSQALRELQQNSEYGQTMLQAVPSASHNYELQADCFAPVHHYTQSSPSTVMAPLPMRKLGQGFEVSCLGLGLMGMTALYSTNPVPPTDCIATIRRAIERGCTFFDTAELYNVGLTENNNEQLLGEAIKGLPRDSIKIATKWGLYLKDGEFGMDGSRQEAIERSLKYLGVDYLDIYYLHRKDPKVPIEESMAAMKELLDEGKIRHIGVSEVSAADLRKAAAIAPISAYQLEWSLWSRDAEAEIIPLCRELGIGIVSYSPLGRGFLSGTIKSPADLSEDDFRRVGQPRFAEEAFKKNMEMVEKLRAIATRKGCTPSQLALAWVLAQGDDVYLEENLSAADIVLSADELAELSHAFAPEAVSGQRYDQANMSATFHYGSDSKK